MAMMVVETGSGVGCGSSAVSGDHDSMKQQKK